MFPQLDVSVVDAMRKAQMQLRANHVSRLLCCASAVQQLPQCPSSILDSLSHCAKWISAEGAHQQLTSGRTLVEAQHLSQSLSSRPDELCCLTGDPVQFTSAVSEQVAGSVCLPRCHLSLQLLQFQHHVTRCAHGCPPADLAYVRAFQSADAGVALGSHVLHGCLFCGRRY